MIKCIVEGCNEVFESEIRYKLHKETRHKEETKMEIENTLEEVNKRLNLYCGDISLSCKDFSVYSEILKKITVIIEENKDKDIKILSFKVEYI